MSKSDNPDYMRNPFKICWKEGGYDKVIHFGQVVLAMKVLEVGSKLTEYCNTGDVKCWWS